MNNTRVSRPVEVPPLGDALEAASNLGVGHYDRDTAFMLARLLARQTGVRRVVGLCRFCPESSPARWMVIER